MARLRRPDSADGDPHLWRLCVSIDVALHNPIWCGHLHRGGTFCDSPRQSDPHPGLLAARSRIRELVRHHGDPVTPADVAEVLGLIPAYWRENVETNARQLRAGAEEFERTGRWTI